MKISKTIFAVISIGLIPLKDLLFPEGSPMFSGPFYIGKLMLLSTYFVSVLVSLVYLTEMLSK